MKLRLEIAVEVEDILHGRSPLHQSWLFVRLAPDPEADGETVAVDVCSATQKPYVSWVHRKNGYGVLGKGSVSYQLAR